MLKVPQKNLETLWVQDLENHIKTCLEGIERLMVDIWTPKTYLKQHSPQEVSECHWDVLRLRHRIV